MRGLAARCRLSSVVCRLGGADHLTGINGNAVTSDANGSVTQDDNLTTYAWDVRGRLIGLTGAFGGDVCTFQYGPDNLRVSKTVNGVLTTYLLDGDQVVTDTINGTASQNLFGPGTDHPLARNGEFFLPNQLSSTTGLTNGSGALTQSYLYGPFGESLNTPSDSNPFQYTGRENDGDGLLYYRARYYCPGWGRFISADPLGFAAGINPYVYAGDNPIGNVDPSGLIDVRSATTTWTGIPAYQGDPDFAAFGPVGLAVTPAGARKAVAGRIQQLRDLAGYGAHQAASLVAAVGDWIFGAPDEPTSGGGGPPRHLINPKDLPMPPGITSNRAFGEFIGWGNGVAGAEAKLNSITLSEIQQLGKDGLTPQAAKIWADYYHYEWEVAGNAVARARAELMRKIYTGIVAG